MAKTRPAGRRRKAADGPRPRPRTGPGAGARRAPSTADEDLRLHDPELYLNRELSLLAFHRRVLEQAKDERVPLLERLRFLAIVSTNLDEFFEIRVAGLKHRVAHGGLQPGPDGLGPVETLRSVSQVTHALVREQYQVLNDELLPALDEKGIRLLKRANWTGRQQRWMRSYFVRHVLPVLTPIGLDPAHPFPVVLNKGLDFIVQVEGTDAFGRSSGIAVVQVPRSLPRVIALPRGLSSGPHHFVLLSSIIHAHVDELFARMVPTACFQFRVTRNSDLWVDEEEVDNLLQALQGELPARNFGAAVRLEVADNCTEAMASFLQEQVHLDPQDVYRVNGPVNLHRLAALVELVNRPDLRYPPFKPGVPRRVARGTDLFAAIRRRDVLLHHPFESFAPVVDFVQQAARDPAVLAVKQTLYRTDPGSPIVEALIDAARAGKEVTAVVELRARFDEERNISLATRLQEVGANVVYGIVGFKTHAKMLLVVRRERGRLRRYVHLGTGNYHTKTSLAYTDVGLITCRPDIGEDVHRLFLQLTGLGKVRKLEKLVQAPFRLYPELSEWIEREARRARRGQAARIVAKVNSLAEPAIIRALYRASQAGVRVDLIVRGICCLRPGVPGISDNIRVRSLVGRFLEHSRVYHVHDGGRKPVWCSSADWMARNLFRRVEAAFPIEDERLAERVRTECLEACLADNVQSWELLSDGTYVRSSPGAEEPYCAQEHLLAELTD